MDSTCVRISELETLEHNKDIFVGVWKNDGVEITVNDQGICYHSGDWMSGYAYKAQPESKNTPYILLPSPVDSSHVDPCNCVHVIKGHHILPVPSTRASATLYPRPS